MPYYPPSALDINGLTASDFADKDELPFYDLSGTANTKGVVERLLGFANPALAHGRLSLESGVSVSTSDQTSKSTLYYTPHDQLGDKLALYDGSRWLTRNFSEFAMSLSSLTSGKNYDVFGFTTTAVPSSTNTGTNIVTFGSAQGWNSGARVLVDVTGGGLSSGTIYYWNAASSTTGSFHDSIANALAGSNKVDLTGDITANVTAISLELSAAWTNDTTRADSLTTQQGVRVKSGTTTRRVLGTIRTTGTTTTEDSAAKRFVYNETNQVLRQLKVVEGTSSWTYSTDSYQQARATSTNQLDFVLGHSWPMVWARVQAQASVSSLNSLCSVGIGLDSTTADSSTMQTSGNAVAGSVYAPPNALYEGQPGLGRHTLVWLERATAATTTWYGTNTSNGQIKSGIAGFIYM